MADKTTFRHAVVWQEGERLRIAPIREEGRLPDEGDEGLHVRASANLVYLGLLPADTPWRIVPLHTLPASRRFRDCWRHDGQSVVPDADLAKQQLLAELREERNKRLTASDGDKQRLDDIGTADQKKSLTEYRKQLRDLPVTVASRLATMTIAELEAYAMKDSEEFQQQHPLWPEKPK